MEKFGKKKLEMQTGKKAVVLSTTGQEYTKMDGVKRAIGKLMQFLLFVSIVGRVFWPKLEPHVMPPLMSLYGRVSVLWTGGEA